MRLYNELIIAPELLPDDLKDHFAGWQTRFLAYDFNVIGLRLRAVALNTAQNLHYA